MCFTNVVVFNNYNFFMIISFIFTNILNVHTHFIGLGYLSGEILEKVSDGIP